MRSTEGFRVFRWQVVPISGRESWVRMASTSNGASAPRFKLTKAADLRLLPAAQLIGNTHLISNGFNVIFGPSGTFKSFYALSQALLIAQKDAVIYVAAEGVSGLHCRVESWCDYHNKDAGHLQFITEEINLLDSTVITKLVQTLKSLKSQIRLVVLTTYARCMPGGDENSAKDTGLAIRNCMTLQRAFNTAVAVVHHSNKAETGERGSGALRGAADAMIEMNCADDIIRVECSKMKDWEAWPAEHYRFQAVGKSGLLLPASNVQPPQQLSNKEIKVLETLDLEIFETCGARSHEIMDSTGIARAALFRILSKLKTQGLVYQDKNGNPFSLTSAGRKALYAAKPEAIKQQIDITVEV